MANEALRIEAADGIATVTMARPDRHNAFDDALVAELADTFRALDADGSVRVVVLAGEGKSFSAGADLSWMARMAEYGEVENLSDARELAVMMRALNEMAKPTVARVQGAAIGGGVGLVAACDIAIASEAARFCLSEVRLGLIPAVISPYVVEAIGARAARRYFLTAERFDAVRAGEIGLVHEVVPPDALDDRVAAVVGLLRDNGPGAVAAAKDLIRRVAHDPVDDAMIEDTARRIADIRASEEGREGVRAFLEKREPAWRTDR